MSYQALYRTYRPQSFKEVAGQEHITRTLMNALSNGKISHAYLFSGPRGTGKTSIAKIFAKAVNCVHAPASDACCECEICKGIAEGKVSDVIEIDAASNNGVDEIRDLRERVRYVPSVCKYKVYIIDEVHMLSVSAFNALLKTLEEPPKHAIFILATTEIHKIPATILSRCQRYDFRAISNDDLINRLKMVCEAENIKINDEALETIAINAEGGLRDALSLLDQALSYAVDEITALDVHKISGSVAVERLIQMVRSIKDSDPANAMKYLDELVNEGKEIGRIVFDLISFFKNMLLYKNVKGYNEEATIYKNIDFINMSKEIPNQKLYAYINILNEVQSSIKWTNQKRAYLDIGIIKMTDSFVLKDVNENALLYKLEKRVSELEKHPNQVSYQTDSYNKPENKRVDSYSSNNDVIEKEIIKNEQYENARDMLIKIMSNPNEEKRNLMLRGWKVLDKIDDPQLKFTARYLAESKLVCMNDFDMILVFEESFKAKQLQKKESKEIVKRIFNRKSHLIDDYVAITNEEWIKYQDEFNNKKNGNEISIDKLEVEKEVEIISEFEEQGIKLFGKDNIKFK